MGTKIADFHVAGKETRWNIRLSRSVRWEIELGWRGVIIAEIIESEPGGKFF